MHGQNVLTLQCMALDQRIQLIPVLNLKGLQPFRTVYKWKSAECCTKLDRFLEDPETPVQHFNATDFMPAYIRDRSSLSRERVRDL